MIAKLDPQSIKGFLSHDEGEMLALFAKAGLGLGEGVEIGGWCGRSALYMGAVLQQAGKLFFSVDHHRGSEENQPEWEWFDPEVWDEKAGAIDTLPHFRANVRAAGLEGTIVALVGPSDKIGQAWQAPIGLLFLDGNHVMEAALADYRAWVGQIVQGGYLAIHDVHPDPEDGGRPPFVICQLAENSGLFVRVAETGSLVVLQRQ
jgi:hypothetical protein